MIRLLSILLFLPLSLSAATHYVTPSGAGTGDGSNWNNAMGGIPATQFRGDTYVLAGGAYSGYQQFTTPVSGTQTITFRHATVALDSGVAGWQNSFTNTATWTNPGGACWDIRTSYLDFEGETGSGTNSNYGFQLNIGYTGHSPVGAIQVYDTGVQPRNITIRNVQMTGPGQDTTGQQCYGININGGSNWAGITQWLVQDCFMDNFTGWVQGTLFDHWTLDHCYMRNCGSSSADHNAGIAVSGQFVTISYNVFENMLGTSNTTYIEPQGNAGSGQPTQLGSNWYVYGNVWRATSPNEATTQWSNFSVTSLNYMNGVKFYNNTSYGLHGPVGVSGGNPGNGPGSSGFDVRDNVWVNCANSDGLQQVQTSGHNATYGITSGFNFGDVPWSGQFADSVNGNFHLIANTVAGDTLASPFNLDPDGVTRGLASTWSLGAYQFVGPSGPPGQLALSLSAQSIAEGGSGAIVVNRSGGSTGTVGCTVTTSDGTAVTGVDYVGLTNTASWAPGTIGAQNIPLHTIASGKTSLTNLYFFVTISSATGGATLSAPTVQTNTILMNPPPVYSLGVNSANPASGVSISVSPADNSGQTGGTSGFTRSYYSGTSVTLTAPAVAGGNNFQKWQTNAVDAGTNRVITLTMGSSIGATAVFVGPPPPPPPLPPPPTNGGTIQFSAPFYSTTETSGSVTISVVRSGATNQSATVGYTTQNGTAAAGLDYSGTSGSLNFSTNNGTSTFTVPILNSSTYGPPRWFSVLLTNVVGASLGLAQATVSIQELVPITVTNSVTINGNPTVSGNMQLQVQ